MFKTDTASLEKLSFAFNEQDISRLKYLLQVITRENLETLDKEELLRLGRGLDIIGKLKLDGRHYIFNVENNSVGGRSSFSEGMRVYLRQGERLEPFIGMIPYPNDRERDYLEVTKMLQERKVDRLYTGRIDGEFLGLRHIDSAISPVIHNPLNEVEIELFREDGIEVIRLDSLI